jgi:hypothetical protein
VSYVLRERKAAVTLSLVAAGCYAASLFLPAFSCAHTAGFPGYIILAVGYMGLLALDPRWFGNLGFAFLLFLTLKTSARSRPGFVGGTALLALAALFSAPACGGAGGAPVISTGLALGGYLWMAALLLVCLANVLVE